LDQNLGYLLEGDFALHDCAHSLEACDEQVILGLVEYPFHARATHLTLSSQENGGGGGKLSLHSQLARKLQAGSMACNNDGKSCTNVGVSILTVAPMGLLQNSIR
jgi:hypothetical protein